MGIGISPLLGILVFRRAWEELGLPVGFKLVSYADDASIFFNDESKLNLETCLAGSDVLSRYGIILEKSKSG